MATKRPPTVLTASSLSFDCGTSSSICAGSGLLWSIFAGLDLAHFPLLPIGAGGSETVSHQFGVVGHIHTAQRDRPIFGERIWIEQLACFFGKIGRGINHVLILQTGILGKEVAVFLFKWDAEALVIPNFGQPSLNPVALRDRFEKIERDLVFGLDPFSRLRRVRIFQWPIRIGHLGAGIIIDLIADRCRRIFELRRWFSRKNDRD